MHNNMLFNLICSLTQLSICLSDDNIACIICDVVNLKMSSGVTLN